MLERKSFQDLGGIANFSELSPILCDNTASTQTGGGHYFYQDVWALSHVAELCPSEHHDFGSRLDGFSAQATAVCPVIYYDIRPPSFAIPNFHFRKADLLSLPLDRESIFSASCLHVLEHIGLGRYGDVIDPRGIEKAMKELQRVMAKGGNLLLSMPVGRPRVEFNAQRVVDPEWPREVLNDLRLVEFAVVSDDNSFIKNVQPRDFSNQRYACGMYLFKR